MKVKLYFVVIDLPEKMQTALPERKEFLLYIDDNGKEYYALLGDDLETYNASRMNFHTIAFQTKKAWLEFRKKCKIVTL